MENPISGNTPGLPNETAIEDAKADIYAARDLLHLVHRVMEFLPLSANDVSGCAYAVDLAMQNIDLSLSRLHGETVL